MNAREAALFALGAYRRSNVWPQDSFFLISEKHSVSSRDMALATQIARGVIQNLTLIDFYAESFSSVKLKKVEPRVLDILRISIYQIVFLTKIPRSAAVSEGVILAKKLANVRAAGFVNAVLRKIADAAESSSLPESELISVKYSHPQWLVDRLCSSIGKESANAFFALNNSAETPVTVQINSLRVGTDEVLSSLLRDGVHTEKHPSLDMCLNLFAPGRIAALGDFKKGFFYVQDAAARYAVIAADPKPGNFVIDGCAAPGGKSFAAAIAMNDIGRIAAFDLTPAKQQRITEGLLRLELNIVEPIICDASAPACEYADAADVVFADVPCSGFGIIRKKPEIRFKSELEIGNLPQLQKQILLGLSRCVKPGGVLLYSTCTVFEAENENVVNSFLSEVSDFSPEDFSLPGIGTSGGGMMTLWPQLHGTDGFFICKMRRNLKL